MPQGQQARSPSLLPPQTEAVAAEASIRCQYIDTSAKPTGIALIYVNAAGGALPGRRRCHTMQAFTQVLSNSAPLEVTYSYSNKKYHSGHHGNNALILIGLLDAR
eukprot:scaffold3043_cov180-Amphora_coffeaeformis.AAC.20